MPDLLRCQMFYISVFHCSCDTGHHSDGEQEDDISSDEEDQVIFAPFCLIDIFFIYQ